MNKYKSWRRKWPAACLSVALLVTLMPSVWLPKAEASGINWPSGQLLPSFSAPAGRERLACSDVHRRAAAAHGLWPLHHRHSCRRAYGFF